MKNKDILILNLGLKNLGNVKSTVKFSYAVAKNKGIIENEIKAFEEARKPSDEYTKYDTARIDLAKQHAKLNESGEPITERDQMGNESYMIDDLDAWNKDWSELKAEYEDEIKLRETQLKEYGDMLDEESTKIKLHMVKLENVPELETGLIEMIMPMLEDE